MSVGAVSAAEPIRHMAVVVPCRNEERTLAACIAHVRGAMDRLAETAPGCGVTLTVVLDSCTDASALIARAAADADPRIRTLDVGYGSVGRSRRAGVHSALAVVADDEPAWIACTDADTRVPPGWLARFLEFADDGADAVLGTVEPDRAELGPRRHAAWSARHVRTDGHDYVHGANLGVRASSYLAVGGFTHLRTGEDVALVAALRAAGLDVRSSGALHAVTSGRLDGRAPGGFAGYLARL